LRSHSNDRPRQRIASPGPAKRSTPWIFASSRHAPRVARVGVLCSLLALSACGDDPTDAGTTPPADTPNFQRSIDSPWFAYASPAHEFGVDLGVRRTGRSGYVRSIAVVPSTGDPFGALIQSISALEYRGKRLRLSGYVRTDGVTGKGAGLWMRIDSPTRATAFDNMVGYDRPLLGLLTRPPFS
jgi:hypothetical protein